MKCIEKLDSSFSDKNSRNLFWATFFWVTYNLHIPLWQPFFLDLFKIKKKNQLKTKTFEPFELLKELFKEQNISRRLT